MNKIIKYFDERIRLIKCPICGVKGNVCGHINENKLIPFNSFTDEEKLEIGRIWDKITGKNWYVNTTDQTVMIFIDDSFIETIDLKKFDKKELTCSNPNCKCGGACKVCKCKLDKYNIQGEMWKTLPDELKEEVVSLLDGYIKSTNNENLKDSVFSFEPSDLSSRGIMPIVPNLMIKSDDMEVAINTGITLERIHDLKSNK